MADHCFELHGVKVLELDPTGPVASKANEITDWISSYWEQKAELLLITVQRLDNAFWTLRSGFAGEVLQKFVNYRVPTAILGDITAQLEQSSALRDLVTETNRGGQVWFVSDVDALGRKLNSNRLQKR